MDRDVNFNQRIRACRECMLGGLRVERGGLVVPPSPGPKYERGGLAGIAERPGPQEERTGLPFSGRSGELLEQLFYDADIDPAEVLLMNRLCCAIPTLESTDDYPDALPNCEPFVAEALQIYAPRVVVLMGRPAIQMVFGATATVGEFQGVSRTTGGITYIGSYHPAAVLRRDASPEMYRSCLDDWRLAMQRLRELRSAS